MREFEKNQFTSDMGKENKMETRNLKRAAMNIYHYMDTYASGITGQHRAFPVAPETTQAVSSMGINSPRRFLHVQKQPGRKRYSQTPGLVL